MSEKTEIAWADSTFNPWMGCAKVSDGCKHCYAETLMDTRYGRVKWGVNGTRLRTREQNWRKPHSWNREAYKIGLPWRVFCASLADVCEDREELLPWRADLMRLIEATPHLTWMLLTKRPENIGATFGARWDSGGWPSNVWMGTSCEDQATADDRIPRLLRCPAAVRFLSCEPLLGEIDIGCGLDFTDDGDGPESIHWAIIGGESGPGSRPCNVGWIRSLLNQCRAAGVAPFIKQVGAYPIDDGACLTTVQFPDEQCWPDAVCDRTPIYDEHIRLRDAKGGDMSEWPKDLQIREFPA